MWDGNHRLGSVVSDASWLDLAFTNLEGSDGEWTLCRTGPFLAAWIFPAKHHPIVMHRDLCFCLPGLCEIRLFSLGGQRAKERSLGI